MVSPWTILVLLSDQQRISLTPRQQQSKIIVLGWSPTTAMRLVKLGPVPSSGEQLACSSFPGFACIQHCSSCRFHQTGCQVMPLLCLASGFSRGAGLSLGAASRGAQRQARRSCQSRAGPWLIEGFARGSEVLTLASIAVGLSNTVRSYSPTRRRRDDPDSDSDGVQWGVMSLVSVLPWFNSLVRPGEQTPAWLELASRLRGCRLGCLQL